jgi:hypothetical protein
VIVTAEERARLTAVVDRPAHPTSGLDLPLHLDLRLVAQRYREFVLGSDPKAPAAPGVFRSIVDLQAAINPYLDEHNYDPKPFGWKKPARDILAKFSRLPVPPSRSVR